MYPAAISATGHKTRQHHSCQSSQPLPGANDHNWLFFRDFSFQFLEVVQIQKPIHTKSLNLPTSRGKQKAASGKMRLRTLRYDIRITWRQGRQELLLSLPQLFLQGTFELSWLFWPSWQVFSLPSSLQQEQQVQQPLQELQQQKLQQKRTGQQEQQREWTGLFSCELPPELLYSDCLFICSSDAKTFHSPLHLIFQPVET